MTAHLWATLQCEANQCLARYDSNQQQVVSVRRHAAREGWVLVQRGGRQRDLCPKHARSAITVYATPEEGSGS